VTRKSSSSKELRRGVAVTLYRVRFDSQAATVELQTASAVRARSRYRLVRPRDELPIEEPAVLNGPTAGGAMLARARCRAGCPAPLPTLVLVASPSKHRAGFTRAELARLGVRLTAADAAADAVERVGLALRIAEETAARLRTCQVKLKALRRDEAGAAEALARHAGFHVLDGERRRS
jgi:hypothetical protein